MTKQNIQSLIRDSVLEILRNTTSETKINIIVNKHKEKVHFIPMKYRVFGGMLQSLNIQFGNFIEVLLHQIVDSEDNLIIIEKLSGRKKIPLSLTEKTDTLIDQFITNRQYTHDNQLSMKFEQLLNDIIGTQMESNNVITTKHDIDVLFRDKRSDTLYYLETKYNDDHDTGKYVDINRKFIKTYAGLVRELKIKDIVQLKPILYYLTPKIMKGNIYVPEGSHIYRGPKLFQEFFTVKYEELNNYLTHVSEDEEILSIFDGLYRRVRYDDREDKLL